MTNSSDLNEKDQRFSAALAQKSLELEQTRRELDEALALIALQQARHDALERSLVATHASTSWRLTAPIREARLLLGRVRAKLRQMRRITVSQASLLEHSPTPIMPQKRFGEYFDVIFVIGCWEGESKRYRVHNVTDALREKGLKVEILADIDCHLIVDCDWRPQALVFFRMAYNGQFGIGAVLAHARSHGARIVFDIDDLVFEPGLIDKIHGVNLLSPEDQALYRDSVVRYRRLLMQCDMATVTTGPLARAVEALGVPARLVPNSLNRHQIAAADAIIAAKPTIAKRLTVGYFSGSRTHERDFAQAADALLELMRDREDFDLLIVGHLDLDDRWNDFQDRVQRRPFMPPLEMLAVLGSCDINIAPLETGDAFCEAKSELKFFEAALVEVPSVVSPTEPFLKAIKHGETGFLASNTDEWRTSLGLLLDNPTLRGELGVRAREAAIKAFGVEAVGQAAFTALIADAVPARSRTKAKSTYASALRIDWVVPRLLIGSGGHRNILRAAHYLQEFGHDVCLHFTNSNDQRYELEDLIFDHFYPFEGTVKAYDGQFRQSDVILATHWTTVEPALRARQNTREIMYFVQDFEPSFAPMGSDYVLAENTYRQGLYCITSGPWCERILKNQYGAEADHFRFPVDRNVYRPRDRTKTHPNIVFFAKPEMPRRCFELGAMALTQLHMIRPDLEIVLFGSGSIRHKSLGFPATLLEIVPTIHDLAAMYANAELGIVFSTTNPSLVPYEMMASGCPVVDIDRPGNEWNYNDSREIAFLADPMPDIMAHQIAQLLERPEELRARRDRGLAFAATFPTEEVMARRVEHLILERVRCRDTVSLASHGKV